MLFLLLIFYDYRDKVILSDIVYIDRRNLNEAINKGIIKTRKYMKKSLQLKGKTIAGSKQGSLLLTRSKTNSQQCFERLTSFLREVYTFKNNGWKIEN